MLRPDLLGGQQEVPGSVVFGPCWRGGSQPILPGGAMAADGSRGPEMLESSWAHSWWSRVSRPGCLVAADAGRLSGDENSGAGPVPGWVVAVALA
jgi:hypothetical protein